MRVVINCEHCGQQRSVTLQHAHFNGRKICEECSHNKSQRVKEEKVASGHKDWRCRRSPL